MPTASLRRSPSQKNASSRALAALALGLLLTGLGGCVYRPSVPGLPSELTPAIPGSGQSIAVVGDLQITAAFVRFVKRRESNIPEQAILVADMVEHVDDMAALVIAGDLIYTPRSRSDWRHFDGLVSPIATHVPVLPVIGNHDYNCYLVHFCSQARIPANLLSRFPWFEPGQPYSASYGDIALLMLDSETEIESQARWLEQRLGELEQDFAVALVFMHRPPYTNSSVRGAIGGNEELQRLIVPVLERSPMPLVVISGHVHGLEHLVINGINYVISAGGGGPRGNLLPSRPNDVYAGRDCATTADGGVLRPYNYLLINGLSDSLEFVVRGFCRQDSEVRVLERWQLPLE